MYEYKKESTIILACILTIITFYFFYWIIKCLIKNTELFSNSNSKRDKMERIYKSDEILDPDEQAMYNYKDDGCFDPDSDCGRDPDS